MLIRFIVDNFFSFGESKEFNMIPNRALRTLQHHKYDKGDFQVLKIASIYGANGSGKSNLIKALSLFQEFVKGDVNILQLTDTKFKFNKNHENSKQILAIDFIQDSIPFYYAIELVDNRVSKEELYVIGQKKEQYKLVFNRETFPDNKTTITFTDEFENDEKSRVLKSVILEDFVKPDRLILKFLSQRNNPHLLNAKKAYEWFENRLQILTPTSKANALAHRMDVDEEFKSYATDLMCSFNLGITGLKTEKQDVNEYFGNDNPEELNNVISELKNAPNRIIGFRNLKKPGIEIIIANEDGEVVVKSLKVLHTGKGNQSVSFDLDEESDGTLRLLDFVPAFKSIISDEKVFVIDEIERSIHPILIKELVEKFSRDEHTKGQLIFTTHESNLLDQEVFRTDEIWFTEKNMDGVTDLYSLNDFKEHKSIDIRRGYLEGRYGSIPFMGNLQDLNWH